MWHATVTLMFGIKYIGFCEHVSIECINEEPDVIRTLLVFLYML